LTSITDLWELLSLFGEEDPRLRRWGHMNSG